MTMCRYRKSKNKRVERPQITCAVAYTRGVHVSQVVTFIPSQTCHAQVEQDYINDSRVPNPDTVRGRDPSTTWWATSGTGKLVSLWFLGFDEGKKTGGHAG